MPDFNITLGRNIFQPLADCENFSQLTLVQAPDISSSAEPCTPPSVSQNSTCGSNEVSLSPPALTEPSSVNPTSPGSDIVSPSLPPPEIIIPSAAPRPSWLQRLAPRPSSLERRGLPAHSGTLSFTFLLFLTDVTLV